MYWSDACLLRVFQHRTLLQPAFASFSGGGYFQNGNNHLLRDFPSSISESIEQLKRLHVDVGDGILVLRVYVVALVSGLPLLAKHAGVVVVADVSV